MKHISLSLSQQIQTLSSAGLVHVRQFADKSENYVITPMPGNTLFIGDIMGALSIDELSIYADGLVIATYIYDGKATASRSHIDDYGIGMEHTQCAWIYVEPKIS